MWLKAVVAEFQVLPWDFPEYTENNSGTMNRKDVEKAVVV
jgi:hypothetical protein